MSFEVECNECMGFATNVTHAQAIGWMSQHLHGADAFDPDRQVTAAHRIAIGSDGLVIGDVRLDPFWIRDNVTIARTGSSDNYEVTMTFIAERVEGDWQKMHDAHPEITSEGYQPRPMLMADIAEAVRVALAKEHPNA